MPRRNKAEEPMRRCIGCRQSKPKTQLIRFVKTSGGIAADPEGDADGRGFYLCPEEDCLKAAKKKKAFNRAAGAFISEEDLEVIIRPLLKRAAGHAGSVEVTE
jgi:predicted RNA-binding protein YlxR (DUF448 family)